jgi:phosphate-selective porin OprO/OprP
MKRALLPVLACVLLVLIPAWTMAEDENDKWKVKWDHGTTVESPDGKFRLKLSNGIQFRYTHEDPETGTSMGSFRVRRYKLKLAGQALQDIKFQFQVNFAGDPEIEDAWLQYTKNRWIQPRVGQMKVAFGRQNLTSSGKQQFVDRTLVVGEFEARRDQGITLIGQNKGKTFEYNVGIYNGNGVNTSANDDNEFMYTTRVVFTPLGEYRLAESALDYPESSRLAIGIKTLFNNFETPTSGEDDISVYSVELAYKIRGFSFVSEYAQRTDDIELTGELDIDAYYAQAGYLFLNRKLEFGLRIAEISPDTTTSTDISETGLAASYYFKGHNYKVQADFRRIEFDEDPTLDSVEARGQLQLIF